MKWFRFYTEALHNRKVQRLSPVLFKHWVNLLCLVAAEEKQGEIPGVSDVAYHLGVAEKKADDILLELSLAGLIDAIDAPRLFIHNWGERQPRSDNAAERMRNIRRTSSEHVLPREDKSRTEEIRVEPEQTRRNIFVLYDNYMGKPSVTGTMRDVLIQAEEDYPDECITHCFLAAARSSDGRRSWSYVESILKRHQAEGCNERKPMGRNAAPTQAPIDTLAAIYAAYPSMQRWTDVDGGTGDGGLASVDGDDDSSRLEVRR